MLKRMIPIIAALTISLLSAFNTRVEACSCLSTFSGVQPCQNYWSAAAVFVGQATDISIISQNSGNGTVRYGGKRVRFSLIEAFRGVTGQTVEVWTGLGGGDCGYDFKQGDRYFVYAYRNQEDGKLGAGICSRTAPLSNASADLEYARAVARGKTGGIIFGIVVRYTRDTYLDYGEYKGVEGIPVIVERNDKRFNLLTDNKGMFQLDGFPAGGYKVWAEPPGNFRKPSAKEVVVTEGGCAAAEFETTSLGAIKGRLIDFEGEPASKVDIKLIPPDTDGNEEKWRTREVSSYTDDRGNYRFDRVPPGKYVIVVNYEGQPSTYDPPYPRAYLPGKSDLAEAMVFSIAEGQEIEAPDFHLLPRLVRRTIEGVVEWPDGRPAIGAQVWLEHSERHRGEQYKSVDDQGRFSLECFESYKYIIHADVYDQKQMHAEAVEVLVARGNEPVRLVITKPGRSQYLNPGKQNKR
jgi:carboxypeptidase family protein